MRIRLNMVKLPRNMRTEHKKGIDEIAVFFRFLKEANLPVAPESVEKRVPPEPDLVCVHASEGAVAFELVELCDSNLARAFAKADDGYIRTSDPSARIVAKKLRRKYRTTLPVELLCYTAGRIITPDNVILPTIKPFLRSWRHTFRRAWLLGRKGVYPIWKLE
jgi:hypothetical protein